jgi:hypothetical protein
MRVPLSCYERRMPEIGQRSGRTLLWMIRADEIAFGDDLQRELAGSATWRALVHPSETGATSARLADVLPEWGRTAALRLLTGGPEILYQQGRLRHRDWTIASAPTAGLLLTSGELAYRWLPAESPEHAGSFPALVETVHRVLRRHTLASRVELAATGKPWRKGRIGEHAAAYVLEHDLEPKDDSWPTGTPLRLRAP